MERTVVVLGGGGAGLGATVEAYLSGCRVIIIDKTPKLGGNTKSAESGISAARTYGGGGGRGLCVSLVVPSRRLTCSVDGVCVMGD